MRCKAFCSYNAKVEAIFNEKCSGIINMHKRLIEKAKHQCCNDLLREPTSRIAIRDESQRRKAT